MTGGTIMLFHVTMTHSADNCPIYQPEKMPAVLASFENLDDFGEKLGVKVHYFTMCGPTHVAYVLLEADNLSAVSRFAFSIAMKQQIDIVPVEHLSDTIAMARAATGKN
jgi:hypothetical protein